VKAIVKFLIFFLILAGCSGPLPPPQTDDDKVVLQTTLFVWDADSNSYKFKTNDPRFVGFSGSTIWKLGTTHENTMNEVELNTYKTSGDDDGAFGVVFCAQDEHNFLAVFIDVNQNYIVGKVVDDTFTAISPSWTTDSNLNAGFGVRNKIRVQYQGNQQFRLWFNDVEIIDFEDTELPFFIGGRYGFIAEVTPKELLPEQFVECHYEPVTPTAIAW
jgi:hypothetical protein